MKKKATIQRAAGQQNRDAVRRLRQADRLARLLRLLQLLQGRGQWKAMSIAQELSVSERTVYRDLVALELAGVPWMYDKQQRSYRLLSNYSFPVLNLTPDEAIGQATATAAMKAPGLNINQGASPTTVKLSAARKELEPCLTAVSQVTQVLDLKLADHTRHREIIRTAQWALLNKKQVVGRYRSPYDSKSVMLRLRPIRVCLVKSAWYLIAQPLISDVPQTYRLARFQSMHEIDEPALVPVDFDLNEYFGNAWAVYRGTKSYDIRLRFVPDSVAIVAETVWHPTQKIVRHKNGTATLSFTVDGLNEIVRWILGWGNQIIAIEPQELRSIVLNIHRQSLELLADTPDSNSLEE